MARIKLEIFLLSVFASLSFFLSLFLIFAYSNDLTLASDDLNYIKSAVFFLKSGLLTYQNFNEPTVYIMPLYPLFLAAAFKICGGVVPGLQAARIIQAVFGVAVVILVYLLSCRLFNSKKAAFLSSTLISLYPPHITTSCYLMTEMLFTMLFLIMIYISIRLGEKINLAGAVIFGAVWALATLCRPTAVLYPLFFFVYLLLKKGVEFGEIVKFGFAAVITFMLAMSPWWVRNYIEYSIFIPLSASSGNPMLQGTYIDYKQTPSNITYYNLGKNALETDRNEVQAAKQRILKGFKEDFWGYLKWYTIGKTNYFWGTIFYWKEFLGVNQYCVLAVHYIILCGFLGMAVLLVKDFKKHMLPASAVLYFNIVHCIYMAFDRYAFPVIPLLALYSGYYLAYLHDILKKASISKIL